MPAPSNPLQELQEILARTSRDVSEDKMLSCLYGIIMGWDDASYDELSKKYGWTAEQIQAQKAWHDEYKKAWRLYFNTYCR